MSWLCCFATSLIATYLLPPATCFNLLQLISVQRVVPPQKENLFAFLYPFALGIWLILHLFISIFPRKALCQSARSALKKFILDPQHLAIEDLEELSNLPSQSSWLSTISLNNGSIGSISWQFLRPETEISLWMSGLLLHLLKLGSLGFQNCSKLKISQLCYLNILHMLYSF